MARGWFYFRTGYVTYLSFLLGVANTLTVLFYLLIRSIPDLAAVFPHFATFAILAIASGIPVTVLIGWIHLKRSPIYTSELEVGVEANPYYYKLPPGFWKDVIMPAYLELLRYTSRLLEKERLLSDEEKQKLSELQGKMDILISGGYVGTPRRKLNF